MWRLAASIDTLRNEVNERWPERDKLSDGTIGDAAHATRSSDHNPYIKDAHGTGVVRAIDIDKDLDNDDDPDIAWLAEHLRSLGKADDLRVRYIIWNGRIASSRGDWAWRTYVGPNQHKSHLHLSVVENPAGYDSTEPWGITNPAGADPLSDPAVVKMIEEIHRETVKSIPPSKGVKASMRYLVAKIYTRSDEEVRGVRRLLKKLGLS